MRTPGGEPAVDTWSVVSRAEFVERVFSAAGPPLTRPRIVAVDGRGGAGKSITVTWLHEAVPASAVVHTDDVAWCEPFLAWGHLLLEVLEQLHRAQAAQLRPPAWRDRGRPGEIS